MRSSLVSWSALIATLLCSIAAHSAVTIEFLAPPAQWSTTEQEGVFYLKANGGAVSGIHCWIAALNPDRGDRSPRDSFTCTAPEILPTNAVSQLTLKLSTVAALKRSTYSAVLQVLGVDQSGVAVSQTTAFKIIAPSVTLKVGETDTIRVRLSGVARKAVELLDAEPLLVEPKPAAAISLNGPRPN